MKINAANTQNIAANYKAQTTAPAAKLKDEIKNNITNTKPGAVNELHRFQKEAINNRNKIDVFS